MGRGEGGLCGTSGMRYAACSHAAMQHVACGKWQAEHSRIASQPALRELSNRSQLIPNGVACRELLLQVKFVFFYFLSFSFFGRKTSVCVCLCVFHCQRSSDVAAHSINIFISMQIMEFLEIVGQPCGIEESASQCSIASVPPATINIRWLYCVHFIVINAVFKRQLGRKCSISNVPQLQRLFIDTLQVCRVYCVYFILQSLQLVM